MLTTVYSTTQCISVVIYTADLTIFFPTKYDSRQVFVLNDSFP